MPVIDDNDADRTTLPEPASADEPGQLWLLAITPDGRNGAYPLPAHGTVKIGRAKECAVRLDDPQVSRVHTLLHLGRSSLSIEDLGSSNGIRLRGEKLPARATRSLLLGDSFAIGAVLLTVQSRRAAPTDEPGVAQPPCEAMEQVVALAERIARGEVSVVLLGETGVGKDVMARHIHLASRRASRLFLRVNCAALSESLIESELFGHERGAFTGATATRQGLLETADGGTVFLDEVFELSPSTQAKLLRVLEQRELFRVGSATARKVDVRFIAATNRDLEAEVRRGSFREDLFFRLAGMVLRIPPLRQRRAQILPFARRFLAAAARDAGLPAPALSTEAERWMEGHAWPGNLRELKNAIDRAILLCGDAPIRVEHLMLDGGSAAPSAEPVAEVAPAPAPNDDDAAERSERDRIADALARFGGNQTHAARFLGMARNTLIARLDRYGLVRPRRS